MNPAITIAAGILVWLVTAFVKRDHWPSDVNLLLAMSLAGLAGLATVLGQQGWSGVPVTWSHWSQYAAADFAVATLIYGVLTVRVPGLRHVAQGIARLTSSPSTSSVTMSALPADRPVSASLAGSTAMAASAPGRPSSSPVTTSVSPVPPSPPARAMAASAAPPAGPTRVPSSTSPVARSARVSASRSTRTVTAPASASASGGASVPSLTSALSALSALVASAPGPISGDHRVGAGAQLAPAISGPIPGTRRAVRTRGRSLGQFPPLRPGS
jgi:hypothetical protein